MRLYFPFLSQLAALVVGIKQPHSNHEQMSVAVLQYNFMDTETFIPRNILHYFTYTEISIFFSTG